VPDDVTYYRRGVSIHIRDPYGHHWRSDHGVVYGMTDARYRTYGRPGTAPATEWPMRALRHGLANLLLQQGSWTLISGRGGRKQQQAVVMHTYIPDRQHTAVMNAATTAEFGAARTATEYARDPRTSRLERAWFGRPNYSIVGTVWDIAEYGWARMQRGHSGVHYEWCHLVSHGLGGADHVNNIVAATAYCNTEQLAIENVLYEYRMEPGVTVTVTAQLVTGTLHLAEAIQYAISLGRRAIYTKVLDARRATRPSPGEFSSLQVEVREYLNAALARDDPLTPPETAVMDGLMDTYLAAHPR
jgi:hypothetical protein